jgi:transglutaminase-like putative cysteine protease
MKRVLVWVVFVFLTVTPSRAEEQAGKLIKETWDAAYLEGARAGFYHSTVHELDREGKKIYRTTMSMRLTVRRYNAVVPLRIDTGIEETASGRVTAVFLTQYLDRGKVVQKGTIKDGKLVIRMEGTDEERTIPWDNRVLGAYRQQRLFQERKVKPGDRFRFWNFEMSVLQAVPVTVTVQEPETVDLLKPREKEETLDVERVKAKLLRVEAEYGKIKVNGNSIPLPKMISWLDKDYDVMRSEFTFPGLGRVTLYRTTQAVAVQEGVAPALLPDLGLATLVPIKRVINDPQAMRAITYRITLKGDDDPTTSFVRDARQKVGKVYQDGSFELIVRQPAGGGKVEMSPKQVKEFLKANFFLDSDEESIQNLAERIVGKEEDPWEKAKRIEKWVYDNMTPSNEVGFARASQICKDLKGDCRQHAMLSAALCRAAGLPARTAVGLIYVRDPRRGPVMGFHMWTEVLIKGQWRGLDATRGRGGIGPDHLKIANASWNGIATLAPLLPVARVLGKLQIEVMGVEE